MLRRAFTVSFVSRIRKMIRVDGEEKVSLLLDEVIK